MKILVACEFSGIVREAFKSKGHDAWSCDLLDSEIPGQHIKDDIVLHLNEGWDMMIAHPPCTYITNAGVRHLHSVPSRTGKVTAVHGEDRWILMYIACGFFNLLQRANIPKICVENPVPHGYAREIIGGYNQIIQPYQFGDDASKKTCLWLKNLSKLKSTNYIEPHISSKGKKVWGNQTPGGWNKLGPSVDRWKERSRTYSGIAQAMADQWG